ncbi:MAG: hypothetical protein EHM34_02355 [Nitrosopumilales archaeon]|nr:MAG: hypothetical protein EHM34_02355 [Nitrosopumilales archaeon]
MSSKCCNAETRTGYYHPSQRPDIHGVINGDAANVVGTYCTKCDKLCDYTNNIGKEYYTNGKAKELPKKFKKSRFDLTDIELQSLEDFLAGLPKSHRYKKIKLIYENGAGIGTCIRVKVGKYEQDITDVSCW